jgi:OOP family OmpA-OmpF porin
MRVWIVGLTALASALPLTSRAQPISGLYIGAEAGANKMQHEHGVATAPGFAGAQNDLSLRMGPAVVLSLGYGLGNGLRAEVEGDYRYDTFSGTRAGSSAGGQEQKFGAMANIVYDFVGLVPYVQPYLGVGAGYQWVQVRNQYVATASGLTQRGFTDTKGDFAYQAIVGVALPVTGAAGLVVTADYRFLGLAGDRNYAGTVSSGGVTRAANLKLDNNYNHTFLIGFRYAFGAAPAPVEAPVAAAVPPSPVSRSYLVFFDWDKATLTDRARQIVSEAAANSTKVQYTRLEVNGYTDTSGTPQYNQGLSVRRAQAVAAELVKDGVPKSAITIQGFGETHLLVPTGAGVREPQNRRVEIIIK